MRKPILMLLLAVVSGSAAAEWVKIDGADSFDTYAEPTTIRKSGDRVKMWTLIDLKKAKVLTGKRYLSVKAQHEYDCKEEQTQMLFSLFHSGHMGNGEAVYTDNGIPNNWTPVAPGSVNEIMWKFVCAQTSATLPNDRGEYIERIRDKVRRFIVQPPNLQGNPETEFDIVLMPDGHVLGAKLRRPSGNPAYDNAVERAINRAQPLPMPPDPALLKEFRELTLKFRAQE